MANIFAEIKGHVFIDSELYCMFVEQLHVGNGQWTTKQAGELKNCFQESRGRGKGGYFG